MMLKIKTGKRSWNLTVVADNGKAKTLESDSGKQYILRGQTMTATRKRRGGKTRLYNWTVDSVQAEETGAEWFARLQRVYSTERTDRSMSHAEARKAFGQMFTDANPELYGDLGYEVRHDWQAVDLFAADARRLAELYPEYDGQAAKAALTAGWHGAWFT